MSRYTGPRLRITRRLGHLIGLTRKKPPLKFIYPDNPFSAKKVIPPGQHGRAKLFKKKPYESSEYDFLIRLKLKQRLRFHYGITEKQLVRYVKLARKSKGSTGRVLLRLLEMRLDNVVFRLHMAPTIRAARQLIQHGHILVNKQKVTIPSYLCQVKDFITVAPKIQSMELVSNFLTRIDDERMKFQRLLEILQTGKLAINFEQNENQNQNFSKKIGPSTKTNQNQNQNISLRLFEVHNIKIARPGKFYGQGVGFGPVKYVKSKNSKNFRDLIVIQPLFNAQQYVGKTIPVFIYDKKLSSNKDYNIFFAYPTIEVPLDLKFIRPLYSLDALKFFGEEVSRPKEKSLLNPETQKFPNSQEIVENSENTKKSNKILVKNKNALIIMNGNKLLEKNKNLVQNNQKFYNSNFLKIRVEAVRCIKNKKKKKSLGINKISPVGSFPSVLSSLKKNSKNLKDPAGFREKFIYGSWSPVLRGAKTRFYVNLVESESNNNNNNFLLNKNLMTNSKSSFGIFKKGITRMKFLKNGLTLNKSFGPRSSSTKQKFEKHYLWKFTKKLDFNRKLLIKSNLSKNSHKTSLISNSNQKTKILGLPTSKNLEMDHNFLIKNQNFLINSKFVDLEKNRKKVDVSWNFEDLNFIGLKDVTKNLFNNIFEKNCSKNILVKLSKISQERLQIQEGKTTKTNFLEKFLIYRSLFIRLQNNLKFNKFNSLESKNISITPNKLNIFSKKIFQNILVNSRQLSYSLPIFQTANQRLLRSLVFIKKVWELTQNSSSEEIDKLNLLNNFCKKLSAYLSFFFLNNKKMGLTEGSSVLLEKLEKKSSNKFFKYFFIKTSFMLKFLKKQNQIFQKYSTKSSEIFKIRELKEFLFCIYQNYRSTNSQKILKFSTLKIWVNLLKFTKISTKIKEKIGGNSSLVHPESSKNLENILEISKIFLDKYLNKLKGLWEHEKIDLNTRKALSLLTLDNGFLNLVNKIKNRNYKIFQTNHFLVSNKNISSYLFKLKELNFFNKSTDIYISQGGTKKNIFSPELLMKLIISNNFLNNKILLSKYKVLEIFMMALPKLLVSTNSFLQNNIQKFSKFLSFYKNISQNFLQFKIMNFAQKMNILEVGHLSNFLISKKNQNKIFSLNNFFFRLKTNFIKKYLDRITLNFNRTIKIKAQEQDQLVGKNFDRQTKIQNFTRIQRNKLFFVSQEKFLEKNILEFQNNKKISQKQVFAKMFSNLIKEQNAKISNLDLFLLKNKFLTKYKKLETNKFYILEKYINQTLSLLSVLNYEKQRKKISIDLKILKIKILKDFYYNLMTHLPLLKFYSKNFLFIPKLDVLVKKSLPLNSSYNSQKLFFNKFYKSNYFIQKFTKNFTILKVKLFNNALVDDSLLNKSLKFSNYFKNKKIISLISEIFYSNNSRFSNQIEIWLKSLKIFNYILNKIIYDGTKKYSKIFLELAPVKNSSKDRSFHPSQFLNFRKFEYNYLLDLNSGIFNKIFEKLLKIILNSKIFYSRLEKLVFTNLKYSNFNKKKNEERRNEFFQRVQPFLNLGQTNYQKFSSDKTKIPRILLELDKLSLKFLNSSDFLNFYSNIFSKNLFYMSLLVKARISILTKNKLGGVSLVGPNIFHKFNNFYSKIYGQQKYLKKSEFIRKPVFVNTEVNSKIFSFQTNFYLPKFLKSYKKLFLTKFIKKENSRELELGSNTKIFQLNSYFLDSIKQNLSKYKNNTQKYNSQEILERNLKISSIVPLSSYLQLQKLFEKSTLNILMNYKKFAQKFSVLENFENKKKGSNSNSNNSLELVYLFKNYLIFSTQEKFINKLYRKNLYNKKIDFAGVCESLFLKYFRNKLKIRTNISISTSKSKYIEYVITKCDRLA